VGLIRWTVRENTKRGFILAKGHQAPAGQERRIGEVVYLDGTNRWRVIDFEIVEPQAEGILVVERVR